MLNYGAKRFDPTGSTPWTYFNVLFATGQYERVSNIYIYNKGKRKKVRMIIIYYYYNNFYINYLLFLQKIIII